MLLCLPTKASVGKCIAGCRVICTMAFAVCSYTALQIILTGLSQGENSKTNICLALAGDVKCMVVCSVTYLKARAVSSNTQCCKPRSQKCHQASTAVAERKSADSNGIASDAIVSAGQHSL